MRTRKRFLEIFNFLHQSLMEMVSINKLVGILTKKKDVQRVLPQKKEGVLGVNQYIGPVLA